MGKAEMKLHTTAALPSASVGQRGENGDPDYNMRHRVHAESRKRGTTTSVARSNDFSANQTEKGNTVRQSNRARGNFRGGQSHAFLPRVKLTASFLVHFGLGWLIGNDKANPNRECFELFKWSWQKLGTRTGFFRGLTPTLPIATLFTAVGRSGQ